MIDILFKLLAVLISTTLHEYTRARVSTALGDTKPREEGRLTINPIKHFEPIGFFLALTVGFGWGKPVNTSALNYKDRKKGTILCATIPSLVNLLVGILACILLRFFNYTIFLEILLTMAYYNIALAIFNILPVSPMDGQKVLSVLLPPNSYFKYIQYEKIIQIIFLILLFGGLDDRIFSPIIYGVLDLLVKFI